MLSSNIQKSVAWAGTSLWIGPVRVGPTTEKRIGEDDVDRKCWGLHKTSATSRSISSENLPRPQNTMFSEIFRKYEGRVIAERDVFLKYFVPLNICTSNGFFYYKHFGLISNLVTWLLLFRPSSHQGHKELGIFAKMVATRASFGKLYTSILRV